MKEKENQYHPEKNAEINLHFLEKKLKDLEKPLLDALQYLAIQWSNGGHVRGFEMVNSEGQLLQSGEKNANYVETFTGVSLCSVASYGLFDALKDNLPSHINCEILVIYTFTNKKKTRGLFDQNHYTPHIILSFEDTQSPNDVLIVDPTYAQINSKWHGQYLLTTAQKIGEYYTTSTDSVIGPNPEKHPLTIEETKDITNLKELELDWHYSNLSLSKSDYQNFVLSIRKILEIETNSSLQRN